MDDPKWAEIMISEHYCPISATLQPLLTAVPAYPHHYPCPPLSVTFWLCTLFISFISFSQLSIWGSMGCLNRQVHRSAVKVNSEHTCPCPKRNEIEWDDFTPESQCPFTWQCWVIFENGDAHIYNRVKIALSHFIFNTLGCALINRNNLVTVDVDITVLIRRHVLCTFL